MAEPECVVGVLVDLSTPEPCFPQNGSVTVDCLSNNEENELQDADKENDVGSVVDEPPPVPEASCSPIFHHMLNKEENQDTENDAVSVADSIEIERGDESNRRHSYVLQPATEIHSRVLQNITHKCIENNSDGLLLQFSSPATRLIDDEKFDFDVTFSPASVQDVSIHNRLKDVEVDEEEEVFFGPVGFTERCMASVASNNNPEEEDIKPLSPLTADQAVELFKEAALVSIRIQTEAESLEEDAQPASSSDSNTCSSPDVRKRHSRSGTFTMNKSPFELLPDSVRKSLPIIDSDEVNTALISEVKNDSVTEKTQVNTDEKKSNIGKKVVKNKENVKPSRLSKLVVPRERRTMDSQKISNESAMRKRSSLDNSVVAKSNSSSLRRPLQRDGNLKVNNAAVKSRLSLGNVKEKAENFQVPRETSNLPRKPLQRSESLKLPKPKTGIPQKPTSGIPSSSKLATARRSFAACETKQDISAFSRSFAACDTKQDMPAARKSTLPSYKALPSKLSLIKPGEIQKRTLSMHGSQTSQTLVPKKSTNGPMKATHPVPAKKESVVPVKKIDSTTVERPSRGPKGGMNTSQDTSTPIKQQKTVQPKQLASNFSTPKKSSSGSESPVSSNRKKSFLPTPQRHGSTGSLPSPSSLMRKNGSKSSSTNGTNKHRHSSVGRYSSLDEIDENSPSALKPRKPRVTNTPNMPKQKLSAWSPVKKLQPICLEDAVSMCTKHTSKS